MQTWRISLFPCRASNDREYRQEHRKKIRKLKKFNKLTIPRQFPKMAVLSGAKMAKNIFHRHQCFKSNRNQTPKMKTPISAQVHDERNRLIYVGRNERTRFEEEAARKSLPQKHFAYWTPA